ncbi:MAG: hypothetical protein M1822_000706 [Bathelium mastoideum]|nr:MAG: hypothetical protein M1822_000706 [Bathelium mastoideum]
MKLTDVVPAVGKAAPVYSKMNFGNLATAAGVLQASEYALVLWRQCRDSPGQYRGLANEALALANVLEDCECLARHGRLNPMQVQQLFERTEGCRAVLDDLDRLLKNHHGLGTGRRALNRLNWAAQQGRDMRNRLISNVVMLSAFFNSVVTATVFRIEVDTRHHMERLYGQQQRILHPPEQELSRRPEWNELVRDLEDMGVTADELSSNRAFIVDSIVKSISQSWMDQRREEEEGRTQWNPWEEHDSTLKASEHDPNAPLALPAPDPQSTTMSPPTGSGTQPISSPPSNAQVSNSSSPNSSQSPHVNSPPRPTPQPSAEISPKTSSLGPSPQNAEQRTRQSGNQSSSQARSKSLADYWISLGKPRDNENITSTRDAASLDDPEARMRMSGLIGPSPSAHHRRSRSGSVSRQEKSALRRLSKDQRSSSVPSRRDSTTPTNSSRRSSFAIAPPPKQENDVTTEERTRSSDDGEAWQRDADQLCRLWNSQDWGTAARFLQKLHTCGKPLGGARLAQHMLGICASFQGNFEDAKGHFWSVIQRPIRSVRDLDHADIAAARWLGDACLSLGEIENAVFSYAIALGGLRSYVNALYDLGACQIRAEIEVVLKVTNMAWEELLSAKLYSDERQSDGGLFDASLITDDGINELLPVFLASCKHQNLEQDCLRGMFDEISNLGHVRASAVLGRDGGNPYALTFVSPDVLANVTPEDKNYFMSCDPFFGVSRASLLACDFRQPSYRTITGSGSNIEPGVHTEAMKLDYKTKRKASWIKKTLSSGVPLPGFKFIQLNSSTLLCAYLEPWRRITFFRTFAITMMKIPSTNMNGIVIHADPAEASSKGAIGATSVPADNHPMTTRIVDPTWSDHRKHQIILNVVPVVRKFLREAEQREKSVADHHEEEN